MALGWGELSSKDRTRSPVKSTLRRITTAICTVPSTYTLLDLTLQAPTRLFTTISDVIFCLHQSVTSLPLRNFSPTIPLANANSSELTNLNATNLVIRSYIARPSWRHPTDSIFNYNIARLVSVVFSASL